MEQTEQNHSELPTTEIPVEQLDDLDHIGGGGFGFDGFINSLGEKIFS